MREFCELGSSLKARWQRSDYDEAVFADLATEVLGSMDLEKRVSLHDVLAWAQSTAELPTQVDFPFGKPITVFHDAGFYIDVLTWIDGTTAIHEHGFSGAFMVLSGSSLHARYRFDGRRRYSERLFQGRCELVELELLRPGNVRPIHPGPRAAHALFHLDRPSVSIVVRTPRTTVAPVQLQYLRSGIAYDPFHREPASLRIIRSLEIMRELDDPRLLDRARALINERDAFTAFKLTDYLSRKLKHEVYHEFVKQDFRHGELFAAIAAYVEDDLRSSHIEQRRGSVHSEPHRFLLALLLNLRGTKDILGMIAARFPDREPVDTLMRWIGELNAEPPVDPTEPNAIGLALDEPALAIIRSMVQGASNHAAIEALAGEFEGIEDVRGDLLELCSAVRESVFFGSLFATVDRPA